MKKISYFLILFMSSMYATSQNNNEVLELIQSAKDSIDLNRFESAQRILDGAVAYGYHIDLIQDCRNKMEEKGYLLGFEAYKQQQFDAAISYYELTKNSGKADREEPYWMKNARKMAFSKKIIGSVLLGTLTQTLVAIMNTAKRRISHTQYEKVLKAAIEIDGKGDSTLNIDFLKPFQDVQTQKWGYKDEYGIILIPCEYDAIIADFQRGKAVVKKDGIYGYLHYTGRSVFNANDVSTWKVAEKEVKVETPLRLSDKSLSEIYKDIQLGYTYN